MSLTLLLALAASTTPIDLPTTGVVDSPVTTEAAPAPVSITLPAHSGPARPLSIERISHATVLIDFAGEKVLTDPWFTEAPEYHQGEALAMQVAKLPKLAAIIASHAHFDHFDIEHFAKTYVDKAVPLIVASDDMADRARKCGFTDVRALSPGETTTVKNISIHALPGRHVVPESTYLLQSGGRAVYFGADTMLSPDVRSNEKVGPVDVALLPVNGLNVQGEPAVMTAEEAAVYAGLLHAAVAIPIHYRFHGGPKTEGKMLTYNGSPERFLNSLKIDAPATKGVVLLPGQMLTIKPEN